MMDGHKDSSISMQAAKACPYWLWGHCRDRSSARSADTRRPASPRHHGAGL